ncbi:MAG TPA: hypothetical protein VE127_16235 [Solirubrobacteraceae bacterium]|nr:hypothetical protein [Solirubrobacteraceae bacterium]
MSTSKRNDIALIGIVLLACGIAALAAGAGVAERWMLAGGLWGGAAFAFATAHRG